MNSDFAAGGTMPDFELADHTGQRRQLSQMQGANPMIVVLSRGFFCPKDHQQHVELVKFYPQIDVSYTGIVTITTDSVAKARSFRNAVGAPWPFLADPRRVVQRTLNIQEYTDPENDPMIPHTVVLGPDLRIFKIYNGYWFWGRPSPEDLRQDLRRLFRDTRPDWDLASPELRSAWVAGDKSRHYPYR